MNGVSVQVKPNDIKEIFELPESILNIDNHAFNHQDFWNLIFWEGTSNQPKFSGFKNSLK